MALLIAANGQYGTISVLVVAVIAALLNVVGLGIAFNFRGLAGRAATFVAGRPEQNPQRPPSSTDRFWSILPLSMGLTSAALLLNGVNQAIPGLVLLPMVVAYYATMMRLAWLYTAPGRRRLGPLFWTRRAAAIPLAGFFAFALLVSAPLVRFH